MFYLLRDDVTGGTFGLKALLHNAIAIFSSCKLQDKSNISSCNTPNFGKIITSHVMSQQLAYV